MWSSICLPFFLQRGWKFGPGATLQLGFRTLGAKQGVGTPRQGQVCLVMGKLPWIIATFEGRHCGIGH